MADVVPMLGTVLSRMIPMLGATKQENMQWVFAYGECSGVIIHIVVNTLMLYIHSNCQVL